MTTAAPMAGMSPKQITAYAQADGRVNIFEGAIRSGKSYAWTWIMLVKIMNAGPAGSIVIVGRSRDSVWRNIFEPLFQRPEFAMFVSQIEYRQGAPTATIFGRTVHIFGAMDINSQKSIQGMSVVLAFVDEMTTIHVSFFKQLLGRMSISGAQLFGTTNPESPAHWLKRDYLDNLHKLPNWRRFHFTLEDNPSLDEDYKTSLRAEYTGLWYRRFILGLWVSAEGAVYDMWDEDRHVIAWKDLPRMRSLVAAGIDYGTTNATAALMLGLGEDNRLYLVDEWRFEASDRAARATDARLSREIREWLVGPHLPYPFATAHPPVIVDPAAASLRVQLREDNQLTHLAENDVVYGIRTIASLLSTGRLLVADRCKGFIHEVAGYSWDPKATERGQDAPLKTADHSLDGARYAIVTTEKRWRPYIPMTAAA